MGECVSGFSYHGLFEKRNKRISKFIQQGIIFFLVGRGMEGVKKNERKKEKGTKAGKKGGS